MTNTFVLDLPIQNERPRDARGGLANPPRTPLVKTYLTMHYCAVKFVLKSVRFYVIIPKLFLTPRRQDAKLKRLSLRLGDLATLR